MLSISEFLGDPCDEQAPCQVTPKQLHLTHQRVQRKQRTQSVLSSPAHHHQQQTLNLAVPLLTAVA